MVKYSSDCDECSYGSYVEAEISILHVPDRYACDRRVDDLVVTGVKTVCCFVSLDGHLGPFLARLCKLDVSFVTSLEAWIRS